MSREGAYAASIKRRAAVDDAEARRGGAYKPGDSVRRVHGDAGLVEIDRDSDTCFQPETIQHPALAGGSSASPTWRVSVDDMQTAVDRCC